MLRLAVCRTIRFQHNSNSVINVVNSSWIKRCYILRSGALKGHATDGSAMALTTEPQLTPDRIRDTVRRIVASKSFATSERLVRFLEFSCEQVLAGKGSELKEQVLALEVFGRDPSYDPRTNSLVRVTALKLRSKLIEYYSGEGAHEPVRIELPKGSYAPVFHIAPEREIANHSSLSKRRAYFRAAIVGLVRL